MIEIAGIPYHKEENCTQITPKLAEPAESTNFNKNQTDLSHRTSTKATKAMLLFNVGNKPQNKFEIFIDHEQLEQKEYAKYLGIFVDNKLSWKKHIQTTNLKISKGIVIIRKMQHYLQEKQLRSMYNAFNKHFFGLKSKPYKIFAKELEKTLSDDLLNTPAILS